MSSYEEHEEEEEEDLFQRLMGWEKDDTSTGEMNELVRKINQGLSKQVLMIRVVVTHDKEGSVDDEVVSSAIYYDKSTSLNLDDHDKLRMYTNKVQHLIKKNVIRLQKLNDEQEEQDELSSRIEESISQLTRLLGHLGGEQMQGSIENLKVIYEVKRDHEINLFLPDFVQADVGNRIWGAAKVMGNWLLSSGNGKKVQGKIVLEIGAGCGLVGYTAACMLLPKKVYLTDFNPACLAALSKSKGKNKYTTEISILEFDWLRLEKFMENFKQEDPPVDYVLGAAVIYEAVHVNMVMNVLNAFFDRNQECIAVIAVHLTHFGVVEFNKRVETEFSIIEKHIISCQEDERKHSKVSLYVFSRKQQQTIHS